ncbi:MAG: hypothetical protein VX278_20645 [Myxococcota bacterium]|nr:hypothetical protein [Myxococcota bacterium]
MFFNLSALLLSPNAEAIGYNNVYTISDLSELSSRVVMAEVVDTESYMSDGKIYTKLSLEIEETFIGVEEEQLEIHLLGGSYNGLEMSVSGLPRVHVGEKKLFFLNHEKLTGFGQGLFAVNQMQAVRGVESGLAAVQFDVRETLPSERESRHCLNTIIESRAADGWTLRSLYAHNKNSEDFSLYPLSLYEGLEYQILACTDGKSEAIQLSIIDQFGNETLSQSGTTNDLELQFTAEESGFFQITSNVESLKPKAIAAGISIAVLYR